MTEYIVVLSTVSDESKAYEIARALVEARLAACVTVSPPCRSFYWWAEKIADEKECVLMIKTTAALYEDLERKLKEIHPYQVPEVIALPILRGSENYLEWLKTETRR
jgi:periplasmic divalent cation tolerance protein